MSALAPPRRDLSPAAFYLAGLRPGPSRRTQASALRRVAQLCGAADVRALAWERLGYPELAALRTRLVASGSAPATSNRLLSAVRGVLREAWRLGLLSHDAYRRAVDVPPVAGSRMGAGRSLSPAELRALFGACAGAGADARDARDAAILALLYGAGLRRAEVVGLEVGSLRDLGDGAIAVTVRGKGDRDRLLHLAGGGARALRAWIARRSPPSVTAPLFVALARGVERGRRRERALCSQSIADVVAKRARCAGIERATPHDLRRTFLGDALDAGIDLPTVQRIMGHASPSTTSRYDRRGARATRRAAELVHVPYV